MPVGRYIIESSPTPAMPWEEYEVLVSERFRTLLSDGASESAMQQFFEEHPCMVPGAFGLLGGPSGHSPFPAALISQPILPSYNYKKPDFMWFACNSMEFTPVMIEIEAPMKLWFTSRGTSSDLNSAIQQLKEWKTWLEASQHKIAFYDFYKIPLQLRELRFAPLFVLIYGRREEATAIPRFAHIRAQLQSADEIFMTYDRIIPDRKCEDFMCVKIDNEGYRALTVPPTFKIWPGNARDLVIIRNKKDAVTASSLIHPMRKEFLIRRFDYWDELARQDSIGCISARDFE